MTRIAAISTCHIAGWRLYGERMVRTWAQHWPIPLTFYTERFRLPPHIAAHTAEATLDNIGWLRTFKVNHPYRPRGPYNYRHDAPRFAHKVAAVIDASSHADADWLIWCDADTVTHQTVPMEFVESLLPSGDEYIAWLDRVGNYPEMGFYVLNLRHRQHAELMAEWLRLYTSASIFDLPEQHDSWVFEHLVLKAGVATKSLSGDVPTSHPFINGPLGAFCDHLKGGRKQRGQSRARDLKVPRNEPYWSTVK